MTQQYKYRSAQELKTRALSMMAGRYGRAAMMTLSYFIWMYLISYAGSILSTMLLRLPYFSSISSNTTADIVFTVLAALIAMFLGVVAEMFTCGICLYYLNVSTGRDAQTADIFRGFRENPSEVFKISAFLLSPSLIMTIPVNVTSELYIITSDIKWLIISLILFALASAGSLYLHLTYGIAFFVLLDFPSYSAGRVLGIAGQKMKGHRCRFFMIDLLFIPMFILGILSFGIGLIWIYPLINECRTLFFLNLMNPEEQQ